MMQGEVRAGRRGRRGVRCAGEGSTEDMGYMGTRGSHVKHASHGYDAGRVEAQRLVERRCALPRVGRRAHDAGWALRRAAAGDRGARSVQGRDRLRMWGRPRAERT